MTQTNGTHHPLLICEDIKWYCYKYSILTKDLLLYKVSKKLERLTCSFTVTVTSFGPRFLPNQTNKYQWSIESTWKACTSTRGTGDQTSTCAKGTRTNDDDVPACLSPLTLDESPINWQFDNTNCTFFLLVGFDCKQSYLNRNECENSAKEGTAASFDLVPLVCLVGMFPICVR